TSLVAHIRFEILLPFQDFRVPTGYPVTMADWQWISFPTFVKLAKGADDGALERKLEDFMARHFSESSARDARLRLKPIEDVYLSGPVDPAFVTGNRAYLNGLLGIAGLILVLSIFNFTNLTAVQALRRGREVGVRKVLGADRRQLRRQLIGETVVSALAGVTIAVVLLSIAASVAPDWLGVPRALTLLEQPAWITVLVLAGPALGLIGGLYPALMLSRLDIVNAIRQKLVGHGRIAAVRNTLVVIQFSIAAGLIVASIVVSQQLRFIATANLGFDREHVVTVQTEGEQMRSMWPVLRDRLNTNPHVISVTSSGHLMDGHQGSMPMVPDGVEPEDARAMNLYGVNFGFVETMGLTVIEGRSHDLAMETDSADGIVINRAAADYLAATAPGWSEPLGKRLQVGQIMQGQVIGVVEDFHFASLHNQIEPLVMIIPRANMDNVLIRVGPGKLEETLASLSATWMSVMPDAPFDYGFLDQHLQRLYEKELVFLRLVSTFSMLAILIACLGLYGLVSFICTIRTKEVAVRKVLGARVVEIVSQILRPFALYILIANVLAWPVSWYALDRWLTGFAYHIDVGPAVFVVAALTSLVVGLVTVVFKTIRAALANPTESLGVE
ncbi:FtsX-like permease family protein, partial [Bacteroidota bacterium]